MAVLPGADRSTIHADFMRDRSAVNDAVGVTKLELLDAVNAVDNWIDSNAASFNAALPLPARTVLTARQKVQLFLFVARRRWEVA